MSALEWAFDRALYAYLYLQTLLFMQEDKLEEYLDKLKR